MALIIVQQPWYDMLQKQPWYDTVINVGYSCSTFEAKNIQNSIFFMISPEQYW